MEVVNNKKLFRFEIALPDGEYATLTYRWLRGNMVLMHTLVPVADRGKGIAAVLAKYALEYAREEHLMVIIYCPYVEKYVKDHPEYDDIVTTYTPR